ncbi:hypothetical protein WUBG_18215 [Wuchereria bancrofti]|uniref:Uncharacterized protein n=1 Tax=Wuchereria bancrofti TaxID=6293 RepID=J9DMN5_WUCBA|nr:hypothetical protein WUBG_18215 [Wuchereria bancrofti]
MGYERPLWYTEEDAEDTSLSFYSGQFSLIGRPEWFELVAREYDACRERVGVIDLSITLRILIYAWYLWKCRYLSCRISR